MSDQQLVLLLLAVIVLYFAAAITIAYVTTPQTAVNWAPAPRGGGM